MTDRADGIAIASACTGCAAEIGTPPEYAPGRHLALIHDHHVPQLVALGWTVTDYPDEPPDVVCPHYAALCADDGDG
jgi:hypothetical protein